MSQDNKKSFVMYQGDGSNNVFSVPMTKGKYGTISVAFVRRGLDQYEYNPDTWGLNGGLFAWDLSGTKVYTDTATPAIGATIYDQYGVDTGDTVTAVGGATITVNTNVYTRDTLHDVDENTVLTWTGDALQIGDYIVIERTTTRTQPFEFQNNQKHIEKSDDNLERQIQEVADKVDNALLVDPTYTIDSNKMNPVEWMKTILRSVDKSVRGFRYLNGWLDYSLDDPNIADVDKTWTHLVNTDNIKAIREQSRIENNETIYYTEYLAQDGSWKTLSDPHKWDNMKLSDLADTDFTNLSAGNFIMFDGLKWKNVYSSATASWGTILGNLIDQADLMAEFAKYVKTDGSSTMTNPLMMRATEDFKCAIAPYWDGVGFFKLNDNNSVTLMASIEYNSGFEPATTNTYNLGALTRKWKNLYLSGKAYVSVINNGYDIAVPVTNSADTLALKSEVDLAANSGRMITDQGVWYAKMYAATVAPSAENGTNYADFSQTDGQGNPIIVIYERQNGAWVQSETITPPAEYDGYVSITSKIWDITEQAGQQGGRILWNHQSKEFTPYPQIISFENAALTGTPTAPTPTSSSLNNQIATKEYVDSFLGANTDLSNLTDTGANIANWSSNVTNCITEIPQDIILELNNGTLTLKAGSKIYVPNGVGVFDIRSVTSDQTYTNTTNGKFLLFIRQDTTIWGELIANCTSGTTAPSGGTFYNTSTNRIDWYTGGTFYDRLYSFPFAIITVSNNTITSIDQVFNGFGFIGSTVFALAGLKYLVPNGRNTDGTLNNISSSLNAVKTLQVADINRLSVLISISSAGNLMNWGSNDGNTMMVDRLPSSAPMIYCRWYEKESNYWWETGNSTTFSSTVDMCPLFYVRTDNNKKVTELLSAKTGFQSFNCSDTEYISHLAAPGNSALTITLGASGTEYQAPFDGYFAGFFTNSGLVNHWVNIMLAGVFIGNYWAQVANNGFGTPPYFVAKGNKIKIDYGSDITGGTLYFVKTVGSL